MSFHNTLTGINAHNVHSIDIARHNYSINSCHLHFGQVPRRPHGQIGVVELQRHDAQVADRIEDVDLRN